MRAQVRCVAQALLYSFNEQKTVSHTFALITGRFSRRRRTHDSLSGELRANQTQFECVQKEICYSSVLKSIACLLANRVCATKNSAQNYAADPHRANDVSAGSAAMLIAQCARACSASSIISRHFSIVKDDVLNNKAAGAKYTAKCGPQSCPAMIVRKRMANFAANSSRS